MRSELLNLDVAILSRVLVMLIVNYSGASVTNKHISDIKKLLYNDNFSYSVGKGYSFVEVLSPCPTNLKQDVASAQKFIEEQMEKEFPVKNFRNNMYTKEPVQRPASDFSTESLDKIFNVTRSEDSGYVDDEMEPVSIKVSGFGGQGVLSAGLTAELS